MSVLGSERELLAINTIRTLAMDAVEAAKSGHPGTPMALAPVAYVLFNEFLRYDPARPFWPNRDRFVLSCGHASMLLYAVLHLAGGQTAAEATRIQSRPWPSRWTKSAGSDSFIVVVLVTRNTPTRRGWRRQPDHWGKGQAIASGWRSRSCGWPSISIAMATRCLTIACTPC